MKRLAVHCCCEPGKHLGWLDVPDGGAYVQFALRSLDGACETVTLRKRGLFDEKLGHRLALDSGHQPIEVLRRLRGWVDA